ncbi:3-deoxy-7-phosphoheptulonate synthase [Salicola sp. Rm-C-2C1-2]|uniref:3-deoxy-7-phosphoheptulonate synthase n=1 Tax=Salicola sp. Rm-C-2C1-2 TaxID=3141321 RepID=UPI0032E529F1
MTESETTIEKTGQTGDAAAVQDLPTPAELRRQLPCPEELAAQVEGQREAVRAILRGEDDRLLVVVGPCSVHDEVAALEYGERLAELAATLQDRCLIVMRAYLEKPRTTVGWKGLLYDPERTGEGDLAQGLVRSRRLLLNLAQLGLALATEALNPMAVDYLSDLVSWTAVGARTTESQLHREMASQLPMPVGFKNGTDGSHGMALNAMQSAASPHYRLGTDLHGRPAMIQTPGNPDTHLVLRGGRGITNYDEASVTAAQQQLRESGLNPSVMVDCSHDNACKEHGRQPDIARELLRQRNAGNRRIIGIMLESFLVDGKQKDHGELTHGQSITDPCLGWDDTVRLLQRMA